ncbi:MAG TPA: type II toxin-antitoxin system VapC family toxin [Thermoanaerobaculia bacterium]|nr:type II toxin-antitoxin system VapC family toxin [Thermoanaerobaculia bacterium]
MAVILDTNAVSSLLAGDPALGDLLAARPRHHLPVMVIGEYLFGLLRSRHRDRLELLLAALIRESIVLVVDETTAEVYSRVREELRAKGRPIPENDVWIAALALQHEQPVVSRDDHFDPVRGLVRLRW